MHHTEHRKPSSDEGHHASPDTPPPPFTPCHCSGQFFGGVAWRLRAGCGTESHSGRTFDLRHMAVWHNVCPPNVVPFFGTVQPGPARAQRRGPRPTFHCSSPSLLPVTVNRPCMSQRRGSMSQLDHRIDRNQHACLERSATHLVHTAPPTAYTRRLLGSSFPWSFHPPLDCKTREAATFCCALSPKI